MPSELKREQLAVRACVYLSALDDRLGDEHADLHVRVVLGPAVVFPRGSVVAVWVCLVLGLTAEAHTHARIFFIIYTQNYYLLVLNLLIGLSLCYSLMVLIVKNQLID